MRRRGQAPRGLTLTLRFAGGTTWEKTRRLPEASAHDDDLRTPAYRLIDAAGRQRGRLTGIALKGEDLVATDRVAEQRSFDGAREAGLVAEEVSDRIRARSGPGAIRPATRFLRVRESARLRCTSSPGSDFRGRHRPSRCDFGRFHLADECLSWRV
ncbi:DinB/UmuC family translesion DNA polymerase [Streptomyces olivochromogenes]|uniref:DinB/UmuC family translesion DNA polymerase n=1 Tax=Streptomyces olivochromogenes TaxID=1963 RepID=UPI0036A3AB4D